MSVSISIVAGAAAQFFDNNGVPLSGGLLYTYLAGTTTPATTYTDSTGATANANPIVLNSAGRTPNEIWVTTTVAYKYVLQTSAAVLIGTYDNLSGVVSSSDLSNTSDITLGDALIGYRQANTTGLLSGSVGSTVHNKLRESVSILDFIDPSLHASIAAGTYTSDLSTQAQAAFNTGLPILLPAGTYLFNVVATSPFILTGQGTVNTYIKPYDYTKAVINYSLSGGGTQWSFNTIIRSLTFQGASGTLTTGGVGFTYGNTDPTVYATNDSFIGYVTFENCRFLSLYKGVQRPSGNLALQITNCNFASCYYGTYNVQGKGFPPGQLFVLNGETDSCLCGHYFDVQQDGLGQISFDNHVFESNSICVRAKQPVVNNLYTPFMFRNCWNEANGLYRSGGPSTVTLDTWSGTSLTTETVSCTYPYIFSVNHIIWEGGFLAGVSIAASSVCTMYVTGARVEATSGTNSSPFFIGSNESFILFQGCVTTTGFAADQINCSEIVRNRCLSTSLLAADAAARARNLPQMYSILSGTNQIGANQPFTGAVNMTEGGGPVHTGALVTDNSIYNQSNQYAFTTSAGNIFYSFAGSSVTLPAGYYVATFQAKVVNGGTLAFYVWDNTSQYVFAKNDLPSDGLWHTYGGISYNNQNTTILLGAITQSVFAMDFYISAYQIKTFSTQTAAEDFLFSRVYLA